MIRIALIIVALALAGCGGSEPSVNEVVSAWAEADASCQEWGLKEVAGEREKAYDCSYHTTVEKRYGSRKSKPVLVPVDVEACVSIIDGEVYARPEAC